MNGLAVKDIEFNGATLRAAQDINNVVWVGVSYICNGIGLTKNMKDRQIKNIQADKLLSKGCVKFDAGVFDDNNTTLALMLEYLPAWLFKIHITPKMEAENPELVERLITYQLKAKDVLANAFLSKKEEIVSARSNMIQLQFPNLPDYSGNFQELNEKIDKLYADMGKLANILLGIKEDKVIVNMPKSIDYGDILPVLEHSEITEWKKKIYSMIDRLIDAGKCKERSECLQYIYKYMNKNYGIVWDQEVKEYAIQNGKKTSTIDLTYNNETYRSIFESILVDLVENNVPQNEEVVCMTDKIIAPLIEKYNDNSNAGCATYRLVYARMDKIKPICWSNREARYINKHEKKTATKKNIINDSKSLMKIFRAAVKQMLEE